MRPINEELAENLREAGKQEFLMHGFLGASMRSIAARLGVTTGAIYRYYTDKEAVFEALVEEPARTLKERYRRIQTEFADHSLKEQIGSLPEVSDEGGTWMMEYIYDHFDAFKLVTCCSVGTKYEHYLDSLAEIETNASRVLVDRMIAAGHDIKPLDDELLHIISHGLFNSMFETVRHDMPREKAFAYMDSYREFYSAGWFKILGLS